MHITNFFAVALFLFAANLMNAQTSASADNNSIEMFSNDLPSLEGDEWTFYLDAESKVYYIDFEMISVNLSDVKIKNQQGETIMKDKLWDLPVNTIYELDFKDFEPGKYQVELRSYTGMISKEITISD